METETFLEAAEPAPLMIEDAFRKDLRTTARWAGFLALTGFGVLTFMLIAAIVVLSMMPATTFLEEEDAIGMSLYSWVGIINFLFLAVFFYPIYTLYRYSVCLKNALAFNNSAMLGQALKNQAALYRFYGVFTAVAIILYSIAILIGSQLF